MLRRCGYATLNRRRRVRLVALSLHSILPIIGRDRDQPFEVNLEWLVANAVCGFSVGQMFRISSIGNEDTWYPTLQKTVWILYQLHDFVKAWIPIATFISWSAIFEDIAHEAVGLCRQLLVVGSEAIKLRGNALAAQLFLIRYLLILKDLHSSTKGSAKAVEPPGVTILPCLITIEFNSKVRCVSSPMGNRALITISDERARTSRRLPSLPGQTA